MIIAIPPSLSVAFDGVLVDFGFAEKKKEKGRKEKAKLSICVPIGMNGYDVVLGVVSGLVERGRLGAI